MSLSADHVFNRSFKTTSILSTQVSVEEKQGMSRLEQVVEEIFEEEKVKEVKREQKRQKKRARRKEKCKFSDLASSELSEECKESKEGLACEMKNGGDDESSHCKVEACERNGDELSADHEHCSYSGMWNGKGFEHTNSCSEKSPHVKKRAVAQNSCPGESNCSNPRCDDPAAYEEQEGEKICPEEGRDVPSPRDECDELCPNECDKAKECSELKEERCDGECSHVEVWCQNGFLSDDVDRGVDDKHDHLWHDDEEKQLLISMGWNSDEPCQVSNCVCERGGVPPLERFSEPFLRNFPPHVVSCCLLQAGT